LLSLPIARSALVTGRAFADFTTNGWSIIFTAALGFAFGFRLSGSATDGLAAFGLCLLYGLVFTVVFIVIGLFAPNAQAAQGMSMIAFVLAFISSTYVPPSSMPGWLQPFAKYQPVTPMVNAVRSALTGGTHDLAVALIWSAALIIACTPIAVIRYRRVLGALVADSGSVRSRYRSHWPLGCRVMRRISGIQPGFRVDSFYREDFV
jgi:ABC-2 type transport system permease protein